MLEKLKPYFEKYDERVLRERILLFLSAMAVIFLLWDLAIQSSMDKKTKSAKADLLVLNTQRAALQTKIAATTQELLSDPNLLKKNQIEQLQTSVAQVDLQLHSASESLIRSEQLPEALQQVLQKSQKLHLLNVSTLAASELQIARVGTTSSKKSEPELMSAGVFKHTVILKVTGKFFQVNDFLLTLENLPWRFYWESLDYKVTEYPNAEITLRVYTLSSEEGLFGV
jgi:MSHA biogenesis protein MshJ